VQAVAVEWAVNGTDIIIISTAPKQLSYTQVTTSIVSPSQWTYITARRILACSVCGPSGAISRLCVRLSVCLSVCLSGLQLSNKVIFDIDIWYADSS